MTQQNGLRQTRCGSVLEGLSVNARHIQNLLGRANRDIDEQKLVTDDKAALREQLEAATGERIVALEAVDPERVKGRETALTLAAGTANVSYRDVVEAAQAVASSDLSMSDLM